MDRNQRKYHSRIPTRRNESDLKMRDQNRSSRKDIEDPSLIKTKRSAFKFRGPYRNRCCYVSPSQKDFSQYINQQNSEQYKNLLLEQYGFNPMPETESQLEVLKNVINTCVPRVENCSQYVHPESFHLKKSSEDFQWNDVNNANDLENYFNSETEQNPTKTRLNTPVEICISDVPRIKIIAEKFMKYKKNDVEVRKLDEKVVCIEYDIYDHTPIEEEDTPIQIMRAFFSIKPTNGDMAEQRNDGSKISAIPSAIKHKFNISNNDLRKLNEKEIEIIDGKILENKPYLEDLRSVLKRKQAIKAKKNQATLDLKCLYEMAKNEMPSVDGNYSQANFLSKAELEEVKELIMKRCSSSVYGINRRTIHKNDMNDDKPVPDNGVISNSIVSELLRQVN